MNPYPHQPSPSAETVLPRDVSASSDGSVQDDMYIHAQVEDYLDRVCQPLIETQPYAVRTELRQEIAQHLYALVQAYQELGDPPAMATEKALAKFGAPETLARQWKPLPSSVRRPTLRRWLGKQWPGIAATLAFCGFVGTLFAFTVHARTRQALAQERAVYEREQAARTRAGVATHPAVPLMVATMSDPSHLPLRVEFQGDILIAQFHGNTHATLASKIQCTACHRDDTIISNGTNIHLSHHTWWNSQQP